jgi:hypothetical protein
MPMNFFPKSRLQRVLIALPLMAVIDVGRNLLTAHFVGPKGQIWLFGFEDSMVVGLAYFLYVYPPQKGETIPIMGKYAGREEIAKLLAFAVALRKKCSEGTTVEHMGRFVKWWMEANYSQPPIDEENISKD